MAIRCPSDVKYFWCEWAITPTTATPRHSPYNSLFHLPSQHPVPPSFRMFIPPLYHHDTRCRHYSEHLFHPYTITTPGAAIIQNIYSTPIPSRHPVLPSLRTFISPPVPSRHPVRPLFRTFISPPVPSRHPVRPLFRTFIPPPVPARHPVRPLFRT